MQRAILSPCNQHVDEFNDRILDRLEGEERIYYSRDSVEGDEEGIEGQREVDVVGTPDVLNSLHEPGIPPHQLRLKIGAICRFTRNFDPARGLTKNTRVIIKHLLKYSVEVETIPYRIANQTMTAVCGVNILIFFPSHNLYCRNDFISRGWTAFGRPKISASSYTASSPRLLFHIQSHSMGVLSSPFKNSPSISAAQSFHTVSSIVPLLVCQTPGTF